MVILSPKEIIDKLKAKGIEIICYRLPIRASDLSIDMIILAPENNNAFNYKEKDVIINFLRGNRSESKDALIVQLNLDYKTKPFYF